MHEKGRGSGSNGSHLFWHIVSSVIPCNQVWLTHTERWIRTAGNRPLKEMWIWWLRCGRLRSHENKASQTIGWDLQSICNHSQVHYLQLDLWIITAFCGSKGLLGSFVTQPVTMKSHTINGQCGGKKGLHMMHRIGKLEHFSTPVSYSTASNQVPNLSWKIHPSDY